MVCDTGEHEDGERTMIVSPHVKSTLDKIEVLTIYKEVQVIFERPLSILCPLFYHKVNLNDENPCWNL